MSKYKNVIDEVMAYGVSDKIDKRNKNGYCNRCGTLLDKKFGCVKCATNKIINLEVK